MSKEPQPQPTPEPQQLNDEQILSYPTESLSKEQISRRIMLAQLRKAERECDVVEEENRKHEEAKIERARVAETKTQIIRDEHDKIEREQKACWHKSGGKNLPGWFHGDGRHGYTIAVQQLPTREIYGICTRCQREWWPPKKRLVIDAFKRSVAEGREALAKYHKQEQEYTWMLSVDRQMFEGDGGTPGSCMFMIPRLEKQKEIDDTEFAALIEQHEGKRSHAS